MPAHNRAPEPDSQPLQAATPASPRTPRSEMLGGEKIGKLLFNLSLPAIIGMIVQALYNLVDAVFVGRGVGTLGIGGITVAFPIQMIILAFAQTIGIGGSSIISRRMGEKKRVEAAHTFGNMVLLGLVISLTILAVGLVFTTRILQLFGATEMLLPQARSYFSIIILGTPFLTLAVAVNNAARAEGNATVAMATMLVGAVLNIILDPVFIFALNMGVRGAAVATVIAQGASALFLLMYFISGRSEIPMGLPYFRIRWNITREMFAIGASVFARIAAGSIMLALINNTLARYGGETGIAAFGINFRIINFVFMPLIGITQGLQPILGFNYGARKYGRVKQSFGMAAVSAVSYAFICFIILMSMPGVIYGAFTRDRELISTGVTALRYMVLLLPLVGFQVVGSGLFQALGKSVEALVLSLARQVIILFPLVLLLPRILGVTGIWLSLPFSDALSVTLTVVLVVSQMRKIHEIPTDSFRN